MQQSQTQFPACWPFCFQIKQIGVAVKRHLKTATSLYFHWSFKSAKGVYPKEYAFAFFSWPAFPFQGTPCSMVVLSLTASDFPRGSWLLIAVHVLEADRWVNYFHSRWFFEVSLLISGYPRVALNTMDGDLINCALLVKTCYCIFARIQIPLEAQHPPW